MKKGIILKGASLLIAASCTVGLGMAKTLSKMSDEVGVLTIEKAFSDTAVLTLNGTGSSATIHIGSKDLPNNLPIDISASKGIKVSKNTVPAGDKNQDIQVTLESTKNFTNGLIVLRSGDIRSYIKVNGIGTPLESKDLSKRPLIENSDKSDFAKTAKDGFKPGDKGYTVEFKMATDENSEFSPYAVNANGIGFKGYVNESQMGLYNSNRKDAFANPATAVEGGLSKYYNADGHDHTYRYAVTADKRLYIYRDGLPVDSARCVDYGTQADFAVATGDPKENLLINPGFEGDYDIKYDNHMAVAIEGWNVLIGDRYNSEQYIKPQEIDNNQDFNNHILEMKRYKWADGWSAAEISQIVDVAPNETYSLSALVKGGIKTKEGKMLGKIKLTEVQDNSLGKSVDVTSDDWQTYSLDYTTSENCKQLKVTFYLERDKWGASITPLDIDNVKLTGKCRTYAAKVGFENNGAKLKYFAVDDSGAYAPAVKPEISINIGK